MLRARIIRQYIEQDMIIHCVDKGTVRIAPSGFVTVKSDDPEIGKYTFPGFQVIAIEWESQDGS